MSKLFGNFVAKSLKGYGDGVMEILKPTTIVIAVYRLIILNLCWAPGWSTSINECPDGEVVNATSSGTLILKPPRGSGSYEKTWVYCTSDKEGKKIRQMDKLKHY